MKLSKHAKFWALGALGGVGLFALGVFAQQNGALDIDSTNQDLFSDLKAVFFLDRNGDEIDSIVRLNVSNGTVVSAPTSDLAGGEAENTLQNNASIIGSTNSVNTSSGAFLIATNSGRVEGESMQSFVWGASNTTLKGYNAIAVATKNTNLKADNTLALAAKDSTVSASDSVVLGGESITINPGSQASLAVWSKINVLGASGALVFNGKTIPLQVDTASAHTMVVNADNGLIINTNNSNNQKIQLTVSGAIKLWEVNNAPAQASPYISVKTKGSVTCVCGKVNNQNSALSKYTRGNKQIADLCQKVCDDQNTTLTAQCGAAATNYPLTQTQWSTDDFCQWGLGHAGAKPTFPALGGQVSWTCESFPSGGPTCTATRKGCGDGIRAAGEQCDLGTNNGKPDSNCSTSCENVKAPKCWANAKTYLGSDVAWAQPNGFCADDSALGETTPAFWNGSTSWQKTWTCKNKNNKNLTCSANRLPPAVAGVCGTALNTCSAGTLSGQTTIPHGDRWSCDGLYGGSNKTCSRCESGYKYNTTTNICEIDCPNPIYRHTNGVTIKAAACAESGKEYLFEGQKYYVARDKDDIKEKIAANAYPANRIVTTRVTDMQELFKDNTTFNQPIGSWDTSNVTTMATMFNNARNFNQDIRYWDTSKVTAMSNIFNDARAFNQPLNSRDVSKVHNSYQMFLRAESFNQPLNDWDTHNFTDLYWMFEGAKAFNQNINNWNINNVTDLRYVFAQASAFNQPLDKWNINAFPDNKLQGMLNSTPLFQTHQPYCTWAKWSAKKWNFVSMGLDACINGQCKVYPWTHTSQPATATANGCSAWDYQDIADDATSWKWKCIGKYSGTSTECSASKQPAPVNAQCKAYPWNHGTQPATATANGCMAGNYQDIADDTNSWKWKCIGRHGGTSTECSAAKQPVPVNAQCKAYPWSHGTQPATATANACVAGDYQDIADDANNWKWKCNGKYSGTSTECSASKQPAPVNAQCKAYPWSHVAQPATATANGCVAGDYQDIADDANNWKWKCNGKYSGTSTECSASKQPTCPSGFTAFNGKCVKWECRSDTPPPPARPPHSSVGSSSSSVSEGDEDEGSSASEEAEIAGLSCLTSKVKRYAYGKYRDIDDYINKFCSAEDKKLLEEMKEDEEKEDYVGLYGYRNFENSMREHWDSRPMLPPPSQGAPIPPPPSSKKVAKCIVEWGGLTGDQICVTAIWPKPNCTSPVHGQCKTYPWTHTSQPATSTANGCLAWDYQDISDDTATYKWKCNGKNGGTEDICSVGKLSCNSDEEASTIEQVWNTNQCRILSTPKCMKKSITVNYTGSGCWDCPFGNYNETVYRWYRYYCKDLDAKVMCWRRPKGWHRGHYSSTPPKITDLEWSHTQHYNLEIFKQQCKKV